MSREAQRLSHGASVGFRYDDPRVDGISIIPGGVSILGNSVFERDGQKSVAQCVDVFVVGEGEQGRQEGQVLVRTQGGIYQLVREVLIGRSIPGDRSKPFIKMDDAFAHLGVSGAHCLVRRNGRAGFSFEALSEHGILYSPLLMDRENEVDIPDTHLPMSEGARVDARFVPVNTGVHSLRGTTNLPLVYGELRMPADSKIKERFLKWLRPVKNS